MDSIKYTIAICTYNMEDTLERSLRSILDQLDDRFEVLVIDDGSTDETLEILRRVKKEYDIFRYKSLPQNMGLGKARKISFEESRGKYILESLDADDEYSEGILDFVEVYHQIESQVSFDFYLKGSAINMAPKELLLKVPYRNLPLAEDRDLWRRLFARGSIIWLEHKLFSEEIGYHKNLLDKLKREFGVMVIDFQVGISFWSSLKWAMFSSLKLAPYRLFILPLCYLIAMGRENYETPAEFREKSSISKAISKEKKNLAEVEAFYDITIDKSKLSDIGKKIFY